MRVLIVHADTAQRARVDAALRGAERLEADVVAAESYGALPEADEPFEVLVAELPRARVTGDGDGRREVPDALASSRLVAVVDEATEHDVRAAINAGAAAILLPDTSPELIATAVHIAHDAGGFIVDRRLQPALTDVAARGVEASGDGDDT